MSEEIKVKESVEDEKLDAVAGGRADFWTVSEYNKAGVTWIEKIGTDDYLYDGQEISQDQAEQITKFYFVHKRRPNATELANILDEY